MPAIAGATASGRSISVVSRFLPRNSNRVISHAAANPKIRLSGTTTAAVSRVSFIALRASGCAIAAAYAPTPSRKASPNTANSGTNRKRPKNAIAPPTSSACAQGGSVVARRTDPAGSGAVAHAKFSRIRRPISPSSDCMAPRTPALQQVDQEKHPERHQQHHQRDRRRGLVIKLFELGHDEQRHDFGAHRHIARNENHRTVFAERAGESQRKTGQQRGQKHGPNYAAKSLQTRRAKRSRRLLQLGLQLLQHRLYRPHHERQPDKGERNDHA